MRVFVTGATGYIGFNVAAAFRRAGHEVWGLARSPEKGRRLARHEIYPVIGTLQKPEGFLKTAEACSVIVHAASDSQADTLAVDRRAVEALLETGARGSRPKTFLYTSGVWVHGDTGDALVDETTPLAPARLVAARPANEQLVLCAAGVCGIVLRPGCLYGRQGGLTGLWFGAAGGNAPIQVVGDGNNRWAMVHVDDVAEGFLRAGESGLGGEIFNLTDRSRSTVRDMASASARAAGHKAGIQFVPVAEATKTMGPFAECLVLDQHVDSRKAVRLLGWQPRHGGFVDGVATYHESWKASRSE